MPPTAPRSTEWWRSAVIYQVYVRSFADSDGDGTGDLEGVRRHLDHIAALGVDALWFCPWYPSPWADGGYDVIDYRDIDPRFGTLADAERLIAEAAERGIRTIIDVVPNHISDAHPWFQAALAAPPGHPDRDRFWFAPGRGPDGEERPTDWTSSFQGPTWTRTTPTSSSTPTPTPATPAAPDTATTPATPPPPPTTPDWYLHLFTPEQPDWNWNHPDVRAEHEDVLRFWFDRGVAGVRIDSAAMPVKDPTLPDLPAPGAVVAPGTHPHIDRDELHDIYRSWRAVADSYSEPRVLVGEIWLEDVERFAQYLRPDEMHTAFNFDLMTQPWQATAMRTSIDRTLAAHAPVSAPATWVLSNHDVTRPVTRYGREDSSFAFTAKRFGTPTDLDLGRRRARAASLLVAALPGSLYVYQGDELGLAEVELPREVLEDPMHFRSDGVDPGRDGCRVPLPWGGDGANLGFSPPSGSPSWLPQPAAWASETAELQAADPASVLSLYRTTLALRRALPQLHGGDFAWASGFPDDVLAFTRDDLLCVTNLGSDDVDLPSGFEVLLASAPTATHLAPDTAAWLRPTSTTTSNTTPTSPTTTPTSPTTTPTPSRTNNTPQ